MNNESVSYDQLVQNMKKTSPEPKVDNDYQPRRRREEPAREVKEETRSVGRPKNKRALKNKKPKTTYFDEGTHQRIKVLRAFSEVEVKDLILVSVIDFMDKHCDEDGKLTRVGEKHIEEVMNKVYEEYGEYSE